MSSIGYIKSRDHKNLVIMHTAKRKEAELTQANLAEAVQVSRKSINAIEIGVYIPSTVLALKIATVLNCTVEEIFKLHDGTFPLLMRSNKYE